jgi:hypothetical protein
MDELHVTLRKYKEVARSSPRHGEVIEALFVVSSNTGYNIDEKLIEHTINGCKEASNESLLKG